MMSLCYRGAAKLCVGLVALGWGVAASPAFTQNPPKIAVMDVQKILTTSARGKEVIAALESLRDEKMKGLQSKRDELNALQSRYTETRFSLAEDKLEEMEKQLEDMNIALRRAEDDAQREMQARQQEDFSKIEREVLPIITAVGKEFGYTAIFNKFQSGLLYADDAIDITALVVERFDAVASAQGN